MTLFPPPPSPSSHLSKEGDFVWNNSTTFILSSNIQFLADFFYMVTYSLISVAYIIWCVYIWWRFFSLSNAFWLENSLQFTFLMGKMISRRWGQKRGNFPRLGGRCGKKDTVSFFEGDLTCMNYIYAIKFLGHRSQRLQWPIVITRCPSSVCRLLDY